MQLKLNRRFNIILTTYVVVLVVAIVLLIINNELWASYRWPVIIIFGLLSSIMLIWYKYYEANCDKKIINNMVFEGKVALARIEKGTFERIIKDSNNRKYTIWNLEIELIDRDLNSYKMTMLDKFSALQTSIPTGNVYVTYDKDDKEKMFIVPGALLGIYDGAKDMVRQYESKVKNIRYLNAYYQKGIVLERYRDSLKKAREVDKEI